MSLLTRMLAGRTTEAPLSSLAVRDPSAATMQVGWTSQGAPMIPRWDAGTAVDQGYYGSLYVMRCARTIGATIAGLPFRAGTNPDTPNVYDPNAPLARFLGPPPGSPNPTTSPRSLWIWSIVQRLVTGRMGWELERLAGGGVNAPVVAIWPLVSQFLQPIPSAGGTAYFDGYVYQTPQLKRTLRRNQVFYSWRPSQYDWREPESILASARLPVQIQNMLDRHALGLLRNGLVSATMISSPPLADMAERRAWQEQVRAAYTGVDNAGRVIFTENEPDPIGGKPIPGMTVTPLAQTSRDAQLAAQVKEAKEDICRAFGVPISILGDSAERTYANADQEHRNYWSATILPLLHELADDINVNLAPMLGNEVGWFDTSKVQALEPPKRFTPDTPAGMVAAGIVTVSEVRAEMGLDPDLPIPGQPLNPPPESAVDETPGSSGSSTGGGRSRDADLLDTIREMVGNGRAVLTEGAMGEFLPVAPLPKMPVPRQAKVIGPHLYVKAGSGRGCALCGKGVSAPDHMKAVAALAPQRHRGPAGHAPVVTGHPKDRRKAAYVAVDAAVRAQEGSWTDAMRGLFAEQRKATLARLTGRRGRQMLRAASPDLNQPQQPGQPPAPQIDPAAVFDLAHWAARTEAILAPLYGALGSTATASIGAKFPTGGIDTTTVRDYLATRGSRLAQTVNATTFEAIVTALQDGVYAGEGISALTARVSAVFDEADSVRAEMISRTEVLGAHNAVTNQIAEHLGPDVVPAREWLATPDMRTRPQHAEADGQVRRVGDPFLVGGEPLMYPGDPTGTPDMVINCRCALALLTHEDTATSAVMTAV